MLCAFRGELGTRLIQCGLRGGLLPLPSDILIDAAIWPQQIWIRKLGAVPLWGTGKLGPHLTQCGQGRGLPACKVSSWSVQPFGHSARTSQTDRQRTDSIFQTYKFTYTSKALVTDISTNNCSKQYLNCDSSIKSTKIKMKQQWQYLQVKDADIVRSLGIVFYKSSNTTPTLGPIIIRRTFSPEHLNNSRRKSLKTK